MCLSAKDAKSALEVASNVVPLVSSDAGKVANALNSVVHVNENEHLEVDVNSAINEASKILNK